MNLPFPANAAAKNSETGFLLLAWCELFGDFTPDNFQPRLYNTPALVAELADVAQRAITVERWKSHLDRIRDELRASIEVEADFLETLPSYAWSLRRLVQTDGPRNVAVLARTLQSNAQSYQEATVAALRRGVLGLPRTKDAVLTVLRRFATLVIHSGRSATECLDLVTPALLERPVQEAVEELIGFAEPHGHRFRCRLSVVGERKFAQQILRRAGFVLVSQADAAGEDEHDPATTVFVEIDQMAAMPQEAARKAVAVLRRATNVFNFYRNRPDLVLRASCSVTNEQGRRTRVNLDGRALQRLHPRKYAPDLTATVLDRVSLERLSGRLVNALEHCALAQTSSIPRVQLVNLWSAVECLSGASHAQSIFSQVIDVLVPTVIYQRCEKTLRYVAIQLARLRREEPARSLGEGFAHSQPTPALVYAEELLLALCRPHGHPHIVQLLAFAAPNSLLCHRVYDLWKLFNRPVALHSKLRDARRTVEWHVARIYRARNLMVHEGTEVAHIPWMLDHLHAYFTAACGRAMDALCANATWTIEEALAFSEVRCDYLVEGLGQFPERLTISDFLRQPTILVDQHLWPAPPPPTTSPN